MNMPNAETDQLMRSLQRSGEINQNLRIEIEKLRAALAEAQKIGLETTTRCDEYMQDNERLAQENDKLRAWVDEALGYVGSATWSPSLEAEGKALLGQPE